MSSILARFVERLPQRVHEIARLAREQDLQGLERAVHQIKGAAGGYGFPRISEAAADTESSIRGAEPLDSILQRVDELLALIQSVEGYPRQEGSKEATSSGSPPKAQPPARTDESTGLPNRAYFTQLLSADVSRARRSGGALSCVLIRSDALLPAAPPERHRHLRHAAAVMANLQSDLLIGRWDDTTLVAAVPGSGRLQMESLLPSWFDQLSRSVGDHGWRFAIVEHTARLSSAAELLALLELRMAGQAEASAAAPAAGSAIASAGQLPIISKVESG